MNRIAILADIHGNAPALDAIVEDIKGSNIDEVLVGGDLVGRGPQGTTVVERIRAQGWPSVRGNHEDYVLNFIHKRVPDEWLEEDIWAASRWMANELEADAVEYIDALPFSFAPSVDLPFLLVHGSPIRNNDGIGPWTSDDKCEQHLESVHEDAIVCGHTHRPHFRELNAGVIVNVGSAGLPFNGDWRAQYAILHRDNVQSPWQAEFRQVEYDREGFLGTYESSGFLRKGLVTSYLLKLEVETARPHLVPFLRWAQNQSMEPTFPSMDVFLDWYDPTLPLKTLLKQLEHPGS